VRERVRELAVLKAVGFSDTFVLVLVLFESVFVALIGAGLGLAGIKLFTLGGDPTHGMLPYFRLPLGGILFGLGLASVVGLASGILPALSASRLKVVDALRRI
jgi:putative ABC transport system permease protein